VKREIVREFLAGRSMKALARKHRMKLLEVEEHIRRAMKR
jgi:DNA-binding CsgD family transcriptional regulator